MHRVVLHPLQKSGTHKHIGGVIGFVLSGIISLQLQGADPIILRGGDAFVEPPGARILRFDNLSATEPAEFLATYSLCSGEDLVTVVDDKAEEQ